MGIRRIALLCTLLSLVNNTVFAEGLTQEERICMERNVYHEARGLSSKDWVRVARVLLARKDAYRRGIKHGARSSHLCDIATSKEYSTRRSIRAKIAEKKVYAGIRKALRGVTSGGRELYFTSKNGKMRYR